MGNNKGITLIELIISLVFLGIILVIVSSFLFSTFDILKNNSDRVTTNQLTEIMLEDMTNLLREVKAHDEINNEKIEKHIFYNDIEKENVDFKIIYNKRNNILKIEKNSMTVRSLNRVLSKDDENILKKIKEDSSVFIINFLVKDKSGNIIKKHKTVLSRNL